MVERFLQQTAFRSQEDYRKNLHIRVPENFNFAYDVVDAYAESMKRAMEAVEKVTITVKKPFVPIGGIVEYTGCTITRTGKGAASDGNAVPYTGIIPLEDQKGYAD